MALFKVSVKSTDVGTYVQSGVARFPHLLELSTDDISLQEYKENESLQSFL